MLGRTGPDRRIGRRVRVEVPVTVSSPRGRKKVLRRKGQAATVVEVSVTGMALEAPQATGLQRGVVIRVVADGAEGDVVVRHIDLRDSTTRIGVQLLDSHSPLAHWTIVRVEEGHHGAR